MAASRAFASGTNKARLPPPARFQRDRQHAFDRAHRAIQRQFAHETEILERSRVDLVTGGDHPERDGQIEARAFLFHVGRREIDCRAPARPKIAAVLNGGGDAIFTFLDRSVRQSNNDDYRVAARGIDLDFDFVSVHAVNGGRINFSQHCAD